MDGRSPEPPRLGCVASISVYKAYFYALLGGLAFSMNSVLVRFAKDTPAIQMSMYRCMGMLFFSLPIAADKGENLNGPKASRIFLYFRSVVASCTVIFCFFSFRNLPIGEASVIVYSTPIFATIFARFLLKEPCGVVQSITVGLTVVGIIIVVNPTTLLLQEKTFSTEHTIGVVFGFAALFSQCTMLLLTRKTRNIHYSVVCVHASAMGILLCSALIGSVYTLVLPRCGSRRWVPIAMGVSSSAGQILYVKAVQMEHIGPLANLKAAADIILAVIWQITIFKEMPDSSSIGGIVLVVMSVILTGMRKWVVTLPPNSSMKRKLRFLTY